MAKAERKLQNFMHEAEAVIDEAGCPTKAIFVTFSLQSERMACEAACPKSEPRAWLLCTLAPCTLLGMGLVTPRLATY